MYIILLCSRDSTNDTGAPVHTDMSAVASEMSSDITDDMVEVKGKRKRGRPGRPPVCVHWQAVPSN